MPTLIAVTRCFVISLFIFTLAGQTGHAAEPSPAPESRQQTASQETKSLISEINKRQNTLEKDARSVADRLASAKTTDQSENSDALQEITETIKALDNIYLKQITVLKQIQTLDAKLDYFAKELKQAPGYQSKDHAVSFLQLDHIQEELNVESGRENAFKAKIDVAQTQLQQASQAVEEKQHQVAQLQENHDSAAKAPDSRLEAARWKQTLAEQTQSLRKLELRSEQQANDVHKAYLHYLKRQIQFIHKQAQFSQEELQNQLQRLDKEEFELKRNLAFTQDQLLNTQSHLTQAQANLARANPEHLKRSEADAATWQLKLEMLKTKIDALTRRIELISDWKSIWQRRYEIFNQTANQATLLAWKTAAKTQLTQLAREQATLKLWLADWQSRYITLVNKTDNEHDLPAWEHSSLAQQRDDISQIIKQLQEQQTALENSRRLQRKLVDDISKRTASRSWREWVDLGLRYKIYDNNLRDWTFALTSALTTFLLLYFLRWILISKLKHLDAHNKATLLQGFLNSIKRANSFFFLMIAISIASLFLTLEAETKTTISRLTKVAFVFQAAMWGSSFVRVWVFNILARQTKRDGASMGALTIFNFSSQFILWSIALLLILQNLGINVTALVTGLGIGGVAVALSLQRILGDLFSSLSIVLDKPFVIGDFVIFDNFMGAVEHIGIKTTRIRSLTGEQIICANGDLLNTRIRNFKRMHERRICFKIGVVYQTPAEKLQQIPTMIRTIIEAQADTRFDRAHFATYDDFSLGFEIVYYVLSPDYNLYMDIQQSINLEIYQRFEAAGIEFAYPTQSIYLEQPPQSGQGTISHTGQAAKPA